jgi:hypothetical protein
LKATTGHKRPGRLTGLLLSKADAVANEHLQQIKEQLAKRKLWLRSGQNVQECDLPLSEKL